MYKDLVDRNDSAPGVRARKERQSISDFRSLNTENRKGILNMYSDTLNSLYINIPLSTIKYMVL